MTISTAGCGRRPSSSSPARPATTAFPTTTPTSWARWFRERGRLRIAGALSGDVRAHRRRHADPRRARSGWRPSAPRTWPPTASSTPRSASRRSSTSKRASRSRRSSRPCWRASARATAAAAAHGTDRGRRLLTAMRHAARSREIAELAIRYRDVGVVGFDIAGAEAGFPPTRHLDAFEYLQRENAHFTIHAGEAFGLPSIWEALQWCGADRLGHGVRIIDDITWPTTAPPSSAASPPTCATRASRWRCARRPTSRPAPRRRSPSTRSACCAALRFRVTVNTDNRLMCGISMIREFAALVDDLRLRLDRPAVVHRQRHEVRVHRRSTNGSP